MKYYIDLDSIPRTLDKRIVSEISSIYRQAMSEESEKTLNVSWIEHERIFLSYVEQGDAEGLAAYFLNSQTPPRVGYDPHDEVLLARYLVVGSLTLYTRAAIRGGMGENEAFGLCDAYMLKSAKLKEPHEILGLATTALLDFTQRVHEIRNTPKYSSAVSFCCRYITENIHTNVSLEQLAKACGLSREHLARSFKRETGLTIKAYSIQKKMEIAGYLLVSSSKSIQKIALYLGFSSHGRFSGYFKAQFGQLPSEYRSKR
jgi:AraC-like DNA-binding protein